MSVPASSADAHWCAQAHAAMAATSGSPRDSLTAVLEPLMHHPPRSSRRSRMPEPRRWRCRPSTVLTTSWPAITPTRDPRRPAAPGGPQSQVARGVRQSHRAGGQHRRDRLPDTPPRPAGVAPANPDRTPCKSGGRPRWNTRRGPQAGQASGFGARYTDGHPQSQRPTTEAPLACSRSAGAPSKSSASSRSRTLRSPASSGRPPPAIPTVCRPWHRTHLGYLLRATRRAERPDMGASAGDRQGVASRPERRRCAPS